MPACRLQCKRMDTAESREPASKTSWRARRACSSAPTGASGVSPSLRPLRRLALRRRASPGRRRFAAGEHRASASNQGAAARRDHARAGAAWVQRRPLHLRGRGRLDDDGLGRRHALRRLRRAWDAAARDRALLPHASGRDHQQEQPAPSLNVVRGKRAGKTTRTAVSNTLVAAKRVRHPGTRAPFSRGRSRLRSRRSGRGRWRCCDGRGGGQRERPRTCCPSHWMRWRKLSPVRGSSWS